MIINSTATRKVLGGWETSKLSKAQADSSYEAIYNFIVNKHKDIKPDVKIKDEFTNIGEFNDLQSYIRENYTDKPIANINGKTITVNIIGMLMVLKNDGTTSQLSPDNAMEVWQWLFSNQTQIKSKDS